MHLKPNIAHPKTEHATQHGCWLVGQIKLFLATKIQFRSVGVGILTRHYLGFGSPLQGDNFGLLLGWVDFVLVVSLSAWKGGNLAELAEQLETMMEHPNQSQPNHVTKQSCHPVHGVTIILSFIECMVC